MSVACVALHFTAVSIMLICTHVYPLYYREESREAKSKELVSSLSEGGVFLSGGGGGGSG